jgi:hypothetical protein
MLFKEERSANKCHKYKIRKFEDLKNLLDLRTFRKLDTVRIFDLRIQFVHKRVYKDNFWVCGFAIWGLTKSICGLAIVE